MSNTIAGDTLVEAVARAMADEMKSNSVYVSDDLRNCLIDGGLFDLHGTARAALTAIADAGYEIVPAQHPTFKAPPPIDGEPHDNYLMRVVHSFENWANSRRATNNGKAE
jgi:hypothetical protein